MQILIVDVTLPSEIQSQAGLDARSQEAVGGKGRPGQEMQPGIFLYHVAYMQAEKDEKRTGGKGRRPSGWSGDFVLRQIVDLHCRINELL